ncbi:uncharacterized protein BT62DRAFT_1007412 [Guyanagaster necrorhizus]|uniref:Helicase ATP-binding domain-containing protein n=1 Tax=Guyanagaster necrorhizus TaxID=856835 RepID=A0A9P8ARF8_9AGAR|nr:uncharacterized protein BT62DRAFT_1007412 [Guyanagaster necrorhizus MCA 3950]KAG7445040.1 hypothetical protein BT62DRAFT_1007412 [Guyanagaster necrorhizus MCA 3950]
MTKDKSQQKGQQSITSFFGGSKEMKDDPSSDVDMNDDDDAPIASTKKGTKSAAPDASDLPPIHDIPAIFSDLVSRIPPIQQVAEHVSGRKLRVATMCSGTESPLLALELIQKSILEQHGVNFEIEHVFSCEIEPFKQAYIERNFHPPILFRDVCELGNAEAHTAYGALALVPGDVDLLVAGTSCVDYSNLNNEKQDIDANGESGRTFRGMMSWVTNHRPPIVILENVCSAPWARVQEKFEVHGYSATFSRVDTKQYYIPHTRTRVYLIAVDKKNSAIPDEWKDYVTKKLKRPASSTLDAFLLASDDPRIHYARQKLVQESYNALDRRTGRTDWSRCESRHQRARLEEGLGSKRPLTSWDEGGFCKLPDFAWGDWGIGQVERVWDLMDISHLRDAKKGVDPSYKTQVWNLSQNVDRTIGSNKVGICPCLTPSMIPYITNRGGPMVGLEALSMQGLPVDKLLLTRETEDQLADLAGNAMSTTVVGSCILAALVCGKKLLKAGDDSESYESKRGTHMDVETPMEVDRPAEDVVAAEDCITGEDQLVQKSLDLSATGNRPLIDLLKDAEKSARLCECEGRTDMTTRELFRCKDCGAPYCKKCGGRPEHNAEPIVFSTENPRLPPSDFAKELKAMLPMSISLSGVSQAVFDCLKTSANIKIPEARWSSWCAAVLRAAKSELRFVEPKRQEYWSAVYQSPEATLELFLHPQQMEWRLFAKPEGHEPANAEIRQLLETPVGRFTCTESLLSGHWDFALPHNSSVTVKVKGEGELVPSWEARLGLTDDTFKNKTVFSSLRVSVTNSDVPKLDRDISGLYALLDRCGTANGALHKRTSEKGTLPPLFMLMDPQRTSDSEDSFVFSISRRRHQYGEARPIIAKLDPSWRQSSNEEEKEVSCCIPCKWVRAENIHLIASQSNDAKFSIPARGLEIPIQKDACRSATALLTCTVPLKDHAGPEWPRESWREVDKIHERGTFKALAWLLERIRDAGNNFSSWQDVTLPESHCNCERCAPTAPHIQWTQMNNKKVVPVEDPVEAGEYERRLKRRPSPFVTQLKLTEDNTGIVRIGVNIPSLLHRALSRLPKAGRTEKPVLSWRLNMNFTPVVTLNLPKFVISSNKSDKEHAQPPSFKIPLRKEQLRSLEWMLKQESRNAAPFIEEEISESILDPLGWRAEGRAQRPVHIRGGVLADQVGYGKTAITLGLIDCAAKNVEKEFDAMGRVKGKILLKATLIIVPPHLTRQWDSEVRKFTKKEFKVLVLSTVSNLNSATIEDFRDADIVVVASNLFKSNVYLDNLQLLAAAGALPSKEGRHFNANLRKALESLKAQTDRLQDEGSGAVMHEIQDAEKRIEDEAARIAAAIQSKRLKGKSYRDAADRKEAEKKAARAAKAKFPKKFKKVEVVIPRLSRNVSSEASSPTTAEQSDSDTNKRPRRRAAASRKAIIISDDDEGDSTTSEAAIGSKKIDGKPKKVDGKAKKGSQKNKRPVSDDEDFEMENSDANDDDDSESSPTSVPSSDEYDEEEDEEDVPKKAFKKAKPKVRRPSASSTQATEDEDMDVDEPKKGTKKSAKRKARDEGERPVKKQKRVDSDPWKLESKPVRKDWTQMRAPPLEMFHFARKVVDEYTYLDGKVHSLVTNLTAERHWVLSGTPPIHDFAALKTIAAFLNIHLGVDDDGEGQSAEVKRRRREQTEVEKFHSFREVHSLEWHVHRHELGQAFLDKFVRQNIAEIDEIPWTEKVVDIILPAAERAIYLELEHHLRALDMTIKRGKKTESDREKRLAKSLGESKSAEEALLKRCSHFDLETSNENAMKACDVIVGERQKQLDECKADLLKAVKDGVKREKALSNVGSESMFHEWIRVCRSEGVDDKEATEMVIELLDEAGVGVVKGKAKREDVNLSEKTKAQVWEHREKTHEIRRLTKELVGRVRSLRYFTVVRDLQKQQEEPPVVNCPKCERQNLLIGDVAVLSSCGHMGCLECVRTSAEQEECIYAASGACKSAARVLNVVKADTLGVDDEGRDGQGKHFGMKLEKVVNLINKEIPKNERVLVFVQFPDLMKKVTEAFTYNKIKFLEIRGTAHQKSKNLETFQNESEERVLLLNVMDESASGANLTSANHAVFLSPLLAPSKEIYKACETQAVGRLVRYGQEKHVYVWRFLTKNTVDEDIYNQRRDVQPTTS